MAGLGKPLVLDSTGLAPAASYENPEQRNGVVADSRAKVGAIAALRRYLAQDERLWGWSYFKLLHKDEADWGLIDRRKVEDGTVTTGHQLGLDNLFPGSVYTVTVDAQDGVPVTVSFSTLPPPPETDRPPLLTVQRPGYGHQLVPPGGELSITWQDEDPDDEAAIALYYDADDAGCDGTLIVEGLSEESATDFYTWTLPALPTGSYYLYGLIDDGTNPVECDYSPGRFVPSTETLEAVLAPGAIAVDGRLDEAAWFYADPMTYALHGSQDDASTATVRALWDADYLYLGFEVEDGQVETAASDWDDDSVSLLLNNGELRCRQDVGGSGEGDCERALSLPACTTLDDPADTDCGYTVEMRMRWARARITANRGDIVPADLLAVDHDGKPGAAWNDPAVDFSKRSWDGDGSVDSTGRSLSLISLCDRWPCIWLPLALRGRQ
jgi:hypothetical protein